MNDYINLNFKAKLQFRSEIMELVMKYIDFVKEHTHLLKRKNIAILYKL